MSVANMQIISSLGRAIYGPWWRRHVARDLGVHACTVGRWLRGVGAPQVDDVYRLLSIARRRYEALQAAHEAGRQALRLPPPRPEPTWPSKPAKPVIGPGGRASPTPPSKVGT
jgi:hypothetical protein